MDGGGGLVWELGDRAYGGTIFVLTRSLSLHQRGEREGGKNAIQGETVFRLQNAEVKYFYYLFLLID